MYILSANVLQSDHQHLVTPNTRPFKIASQDSSQIFPSQIRPSLQEHTHRNAQCKSIQYTPSEIFINYFIEVPNPPLRFFLFLS